MVLFSLLRSEETATSSRLDGYRPPPLGVTTVIQETSTSMLHGRLCGAPLDVGYLQT